MKPVTVTQSWDDRGVHPRGHRVIFLGVERAPKVWFVDSHVEPDALSQIAPKLPRPSARIKVAGGTMDYDFPLGETCLVLRPGGTDTQLALGKTDPNRHSDWVVVDPLTAAAAQAECS